MKRAWAYLLLAATVVLASANDVQAQASVRVQLYWQWSDGAWRPHRYAWNARDGRYLPPRSGLRIDVGFLPPPGYCREWIPGVPPGHQPPPVPCDELFLPYGYLHAGVLILGSPGYEGPRIRDTRFRWRAFDRMRIERGRAERERRAWERREHIRSYSSVGYKESARDDRGRGRDHRDDHARGGRKHGRGGGR